MTDHDEAARSAPAVGNDVLKQLDAALQVEPSRAFADGVRARVNRSRTTTTRMWWGLAAAASVGLVTMTLWRPATVAPANDAPVQVAVAPTQTAAPVVPSMSPESVEAVAPVAPPAVTRREATTARATVGAASTEPHLEVITNQGAVLRQLWASAQSGPMVETVAEVAVPVPAVEVKPIAPLALAPIVVEPIVVTEIGRIPGNAGAAPVIRRVNATKETR